MSENPNTTGQTAEPDSIMQHIQDMIGDLLKNAVDKMQKNELGEKLGDIPSDVSGKDTASAQMDINEIKNFVDVMQKFIDNVKIMVMQLETGNKESGETDDKFLDGYMATADNILEIAAFSMKDNLTGLSNRYGFDNRLILEWNRAVRDKSSLSLVIFAVDGFSECEDSKKQDETLKTVSDTLENSIKRSTDFIARWSESEFAALLPITDTNGASIVAERIRTEIGNMNIPCILDKSNKSTVSIGVCVSTPEPHEHPSDFITKAHDAFNKAKESGGDSIIKV